MRLPLVAVLVASVGAALGADRSVSGEVVTRKREVVPGIVVVARSGAEQRESTTDREGRFRLSVPEGPVTIAVRGKNLVPQERSIAAAGAIEHLVIEVDFVVPPIHERLVITASALDPGIDRRNDAVYRSTLFSRDDQLFHTLDAGISAGQHEGGGKSLEIRRFGFNLDHGGVSGGLKVLVDGVQQNQGTQGHGQGYLGSLKSVTPELIQEVDILNGPFSAEYGDFSGLGVVHLRLRESLPDAVTARIQGGSFGSSRAFGSWSPELRTGEGFLAYEGSRTDGPFLNPLRYRRDTLTGNYSRDLGERGVLGFKLNLSANRFSSSGQIPLDEVAAGRLDRFGFLDPSSGGRVRASTAGVYYRTERASGDTFKVDGFVARSLFDLYSNFTFFLNDRVRGDGIQQHDSRLQEGVNTQYLHPYRLFGAPVVLTLGGNFHDNQIRLGLYPQAGRVPFGTAGLANAHVSNGAGYLQQGVDLARGRLHLETGLRYDYFRFGIRERGDPPASGDRGAGRLQPKLGVAYRPSQRVPFSLHVNYGRGISSQDARGVVQYPEGGRVSTTDFYQAGVSFHRARVSFSADAFLIDRSNEAVYIPDDGSIELKGPSRANGFELKSSIQLTRRLAVDGGLTRVSNAFYRATLPRAYVSSAPHASANAGLTLSGWRGWTGSLRLRYISSYRLDELDAGIRASGLTVVDFGLTRRVRRWLDFNLAIDNLTDKTYYETQNYFESRLRPDDAVVARIHGTPGYPIGFSVGLTFRMGGK
jgi:outer membrane receptor protein involved in Fe transport